MIIRRSHLYFGLLLVPWAMLYGVTGYLFNHPTHFADQSVQRFGRDVLLGTAWDALKSPPQIASDVVEQLNERFGSHYLMVNEAPVRYARGAVSATLEDSNMTYQLAVETDGSSGTLRLQPKPEATAKPKVAPFAVEPRKTNGATDEKPSESIPLTSASKPIHVEDGIDAVANDSMKLIFARLVPDVDVTAHPIKLANVPDLEFQMTDGSESWNVRYNAKAGSVSGSTIEERSADALSWRRFMTRLHTAHGYPNETNARWFWAVIVDVMAFVMVFWGVSGLVMWWQIKATRPWGTVFLATSLLFALYLGVGMNSLLKP
jgi:hypothetical protein